MPTPFRPTDVTRKVAHVNFPMTHEAYARLKEAAAKANMKPAEFTRQAITFAIDNMVVPDVQG